MRDVCPIGIGSCYCHCHCARTFIIVTGWIASEFFINSVIYQYVQTHTLSLSLPCSLIRSHPCFSAVHFLWIFIFLKTIFHFISTKRIGSLYEFPIKWCKWNALNAHYSLFMDAHIKRSVFSSLEPRYSQWKLIIFEVLAHELNAWSDSFIQIRFRYAIPLLLLLCVFVHLKVFIGRALTVSNFFLSLSLRFDYNNFIWMNVVTSNHFAYEFRI